MRNVDPDEPTSCLDHVYLGCIQRECKPNEIIIAILPLLVQIVRTFATVTIFGLCTFW